jgi:hypothetical protein
MELRICELNVPDSSGTIWSNDTFSNCIGANYFGLVGPQEEDTLNLINVSHQIMNTRIKDGWFIGDLKVLNTKNGRLLNYIISDEENFNNVAFRIHGTGDIDENGTIFNLKILSINVVDK